MPDPAYPVYRNGATLLSDGVPVVMPLLEEKDFKPSLDSSDLDAKLMYLNFPNNPTGAVVDGSFLEELVDLALNKGFIICYDNAYSEIAFEDYRSPSILQIQRARDVAIEFHSCSKMLSVTGDRIGFAVGNRELISGLIEVKSQIDSGPSSYVQKAATRALENFNSKDIAGYMQDCVRTYQERRDILVKGLNSLGLKCLRPKATFYVWAHCGNDSVQFAQKMLNADIVVTPGIGFGEYGEGYARFALTISKEKIKVALERMQKIL